MVSITDLTPTTKRPNNIELQTNAPWSFTFYQGVGIHGEDIGIWNIVIRHLLYQLVTSQLELMEGGGGGGSRSTGENHRAARVRILAAWY